MTRVVFGAALDDGAWPGPLAAARARGRDGVLDEVWVGPRGLLALLETRLGLVGPDASTQGERAAVLAPRLQVERGFWSTSAEADALACASALLDVREALVEGGLDIDALTTRELGLLPERLRAVARVTRALPAGLAERALACAAAMAVRDAGVVEVRVVDDELAPCWRAVLEALRRRGAAIVRHECEVVDVGGDLGAARGTGPLVFGADGSLCVVRPDSADAAAAEVAAALAAQRDLHGIVIVSPDAMLDEALARTGLPCTGARGDAGTDAALQIVPLVVALALDAPDPMRAWELASLPWSPIPRAVASRLRAALEQAPSLSAPQVRSAIDAGLAQLPAQRQEAARRRIDALLPTHRTVAATMSSSAREGSLSIARLREKLGVLLPWLHGIVDDDPHHPLAGAIAHARALLRIADALGLSSWTAPQRKRALEIAADAVRARAPRAAEAGLAVVGDAAAVLGPARIVVWWGFDRESARLTPMPRFSRHERAALATLHCQPPDDAARATMLARVSRRPLMAAVDALWLCAPRRGADGRERHLHPLWDELVARAPADEGEAALRAVVARRLPAAARVVVAARPQLLARDVMHATPQAIAPRDVESPSSQERLVGCPFAWLMDRQRLVSRVRALPRGARLQGIVLHDVLAGVLLEVARLHREGGAALAPAQVQDKARVVFDDVVVQRAGELLLPGNEGTRLRTRELGARAAQELLLLLTRNGLTVHSVEEERRKGVPPRELAGRADLVARSADGLVVIDHKSGRDRDRRALLREGAAAQLLAYAFLHRDVGAPWPALAFFQMSSQRLFVAGAPLQGADVVDAPPTERAFAALRGAIRAAFDELAAGTVRAPGALHDDPKAGIVDNEGAPLLVLPSPCMTCRADLLCGRALHVEARDE